MNLQAIRRFFMPYLTGPACVLDANCGESASFPTASEQCTCTTAVGGLNELYFIPCTETFSETNVTNPVWWAGLLPASSGGTSSITGGTLGRSGIGLGSITRKATKTERVGSCRTEQLTSVTWAVKFQIKCFDKSSARATCAMLNELILNGESYLLVARMCDGDDNILPIGRFASSDFNWTVPDNFEENQVAEIELSWKELGFPCTVDVPGLSAVLPKLS